MTRPSRPGLTRRQAILGNVALAASGRPALARSGATFHVDPEGDDARDGLTPDTAWRSLAGIREGWPAAGDTVLLRRGSLWRETLRPAASHLRLGAYGRGPKPVVTGADAILADRRIGRYFGLALWAGDSDAEPTQVFRAGHRLLRVRHVSQLRDDEAWCWNPNEGVIVATPLDAPAPPPLEVSLRDSALDAKNRVGLVVEGLALRHGASDCIAARSLDASLVVDCDIVGGYLSGVQLGGKLLRRDIAIRANRIADCGGVGIGLGGQIENWLIEDNLVERCATLTERAVGDGRERSFAWTAGIKNWGWAEAGWQNGYAIRRNVVRDCGPAAAALRRYARTRHGHGIWCDEVLEPATRPSIHENVVSRCWSRGVYLEKTDDHDATGNIVRDCGAAEDAAAIEVQSNRYGYDIVLDQPDDNLPRRVSGNRVADNVVEGAAWALTVYCLDDGCSVSGTRVERNVLAATPGRGGAISALGGGANNGVNGTGNTYADNCVALRRASLSWDGRRFGEIAAFEAASGGAVLGTRPVGAEGEGSDPADGCGHR